MEADKAFDGDVSARPSTTSPITIEYILSMDAQIESLSKRMHTAEANIKALEEMRLRVDTFIEFAAWTPWIKVGCVNWQLEDFVRAMRTHFPPLVAKDYVSRIYVLTHTNPNMHPQVFICGQDGSKMIDAIPAIFRTELGDSPGDGVGIVDYGTTVNTMCETAAVHDIAALVALGYVVRRVLGRVDDALAFDPMARFAVSEF